MNKMCDFRAAKKQFLIVKHLWFLADCGRLLGANHTTGRDAGRPDAQAMAPSVGQQSKIQAVGCAHLNVAPRGGSALLVSP